jgi:PhnB protein
MTIQPYLFFEGRAEEAIEFYKSALNAEVQMLMRHKDSPVPPQPGMVPPGAENKVMHASLRVGDTVMNLSDGGCSGNTKFGGMSWNSNWPMPYPSTRRAFFRNADGDRGR